MLFSDINGLSRAAALCGFNYAVAYGVLPMAVSGAAVDPNVGATLSAPLRIVMTLLNVRLGYWGVSPRVINKEPEQPDDYEFLMSVSSKPTGNWISALVR